MISVERNLLFFIFGLAVVSRTTGTDPKGPHSTVRIKVKKAAVIIGVCVHRRISLSGGQGLSGPGSQWERSKANLLEDARQPGGLEWN